MTKLYVLQKRGQTNVQSRMEKFNEHRKVHTRISSHEGEACLNINLCIGIQKIKTDLFYKNNRVSFIDGFLLMPWNTE